jgi:hypothetical protein
MQGFDMLYQQGLYDHVRKLIRTNDETKWLTWWIQQNLFSLRRDAVHIDNHDEIPAVKEFGMRPKWVQKEDGTWEEKYIFDDVQLGIASSRAAAILIGLLPSGAFLVDDLQREGYFGERHPVQLRDLPSYNYATNASDLYDLLYHVKTSDLFQRGIVDVPKIRQGYIENGVLQWSSWKNEHDQIVPLQFTTEREQGILCVNMKGEEGKCQVPIPIRAKGVGVLDLIRGEWLEPEEVDSLVKPVSEGFTVVLPAHCAQLVYFSLH